MGRSKKNKRRYAVTEDVDEIRKIFKESCSKSEVCRGLGIPVNGGGIHLVNDLMCEYDIDISHFDYGYSKKIKNPRIKKNCPVCGKVFVAHKGSAREKTTCSYGCSNKYFRTGNGNGQYNDEAGSSNYRRRTIDKFGPKCQSCGYDEHEELLQVHHRDSNRKNNKFSNLVVLCPTCHWALTLKVATLTEERKVVF